MNVPATEQGAWAQELIDSGRPATLIKHLISFVDAVEAIYDAAIRAYLAATFVTVRKISEAEYTGFRRTLSRAQRQASAVVGKQGPTVLAATADFVARQAGAKRKVPLPRTIRDDFVRAARKYINGELESLSPAAKKAAHDWAAAGRESAALKTALAALLRRAKGHAATVIRSELQTAYTGIVKQQAGALGFTQIRRIVAEHGCPRCKALEGLHTVDSANAFAIPHPNCACLFEPVITEGTIDMAKTLSFNAIRQLLQGSIPKQKGQYAYVADVYDDAVVYTVDGTTDSSGSYVTKTYRAAYVIDEKNVVTLGQPEEVQPVLTYEPVVTMGRYDLASSTATFTDGHTVRTGKIFEAGTYPDKAFAMTAEELAAAVTDFAPVDVDLEHMPTILDGKLGKLTTVKLAENGTDLLGDVELPEWLTSAIGDTAIKVSTTWDRAKKRIAKLALVLDPRVPDAAVFAAFAGRRHSAGDTKDFQSVHDLMVSHGAACTADHSAASSAAEEPSMTTPATTQDAYALLGTLLKQEPASTQQPASPPATPQDTAELATLKQQLAALQRANIEQAAASFANDVIADRRSLPADRAAIIADYILAAEDDAVTPKQVAFMAGSEAKTGTRIEALRARYMGLRQHDLFRQQLPDEARALFAAHPGDTPEKISEERIAKLRDMTSLGQQSAAK